MYKDDLNVMRFLGEVIDINDPDKNGKIRVRVFGKFDELNDDEIPWAISAVFMKGGDENGSGEFSLPKVGSFVEIEFDNGCIYSPKWKYTNSISKKLKEKLDIDDYYENAQVLIYDTKLNIFVYYIKNSEQGFLIRTKTDEEADSNQIWIKEDNSITLKTADEKELTISKDKIFAKFSDSRIFEINEQGISIGSKDKSAEPGVLGEKAAQLHKDHISETDNIITELIKYATTQAAASGSVTFLAPLASGYTTLLTGLVQIKIKLNILKSIDADNIKSKKITLD